MQARPMAARPMSPCQTHSTIPLAAHLSAKSMLPRAVTGRACNL